MSYLSSAIVVQSFCLLPDSFSHSYIKDLQDPSKIKSFQMLDQ